MDIIHAGKDRKEIRIIRRIIDFDSVISLSGKSDYKLTIPSSVYKDNPINVGHYIYIDNTEFGGIVDRIVSLGERIEIYGKNWREYLNKNIIVPEKGKSHYEVYGNASEIIRDLIIDNFNNFIVEDSNIIVNDSFRYEYIGEAVKKMLEKENSRLSIVYKNRNVILKPVKIIDWASKYEFNDDYGVLLKVDMDKSNFVNHIVALGKGELENRLVIEAWLLKDGSITYDSTYSDLKYTGVEKITYKLDYPNADGELEIKEKIVEKFKESKGKVKTEMDLSASNLINVDLGDKVSSRERLLNIRSIQIIDTKILKIKENGIAEIRYKVKGE